MKWETPVLFFLRIVYYISFDQQSSADVLQKNVNTGVFCFSQIFKNTFAKEHLRWLLLYMLYTHDVTWNLSRWNNGCNGNYKKNPKKLNHFDKIVFWNKLCLLFHFLSLSVFISIQNIGWSIPLIMALLFYLHCDILKASFDFNVTEPIRQNIANLFFKMFWMKSLRS